MAAACCVVFVCAEQETLPCDVDCVVGDWFDWGDCNHATGTRSRHRDVTYEMRNLGRVCPPLWVSRPDNLSRFVALS